VNVRNEPLFSSQPRDPNTFTEASQAQRPRQVGVCLKHLPSDPSLPFHNGNVPWQRVINSKGNISTRNPNGAANQAQVLRGEGVTVNRGNMGELMVDFEEYGWFPVQLPSDAAAGLQPFDD